MTTPRALALLTGEVPVPSSSASQSPIDELVKSLQEGRFADVLSSQASRDVLHHVSSDPLPQPSATFLALLRERVGLLTSDSNRSVSG